MANDTQWKRIKQAQAKHGAAIGGIKTFLKESRRKHVDAEIQLGKLEARLDRAERLLYLALMILAIAPFVLIFGS